MGRRPLVDLIVEPFLFDNVFFYALFLFILKFQLDFKISVR